MNCPVCASAVPEGRTSCAACGSSPARTCPQCHTASPPGFKFCGECGQRLGQPGGAARPEAASPGERRHATVLFSDLTGYTTLSERLDPEEVKELMGLLFGQIAQIVARYEGLIEKFIGDAVMVLFGVPVSHEDDAVRAVRAAREIHAAVAALSPRVERSAGLALRMHTGINTGLVVTGGLDGEPGRPNVTGDTINVASRLTGLAGPGEIVVGPVTHSLVERFFECEALAPAAVKGKAEPVAAHRVLAPKKLPQSTRRAGGRRARLVGRASELGRLQEAARRLAGGRGAAITVQGDPGTGKSRLVEELHGTLDPGSFRWLEASCYAYTQNVPYHPFATLFGTVFGVEEGDPPDVVRRRLEAAITALGTRGSPGWATATLPFVGSLFPAAFPQAGEFRTESWLERFHRAVGECVAALAAQRPLVVLIEDVHWADPSSLALVRFLASRGESRTLILCTARPPFALLPPSRGEGPAAPELIALEPLPPEASRELLASLLEDGAAPRGLREFVLERAEGNPFYLEEIVSTLIETGALVRENGSWRLAEGYRESELSPTIHGILSSRIDRLEPDLRRLLQEASVIGRTFSLGLLQRVDGRPGDLGALLRELERLDLVRLAAEAPEREYAFRHALTQEVVYRSLLRSERRLLHERIGRTIEGTDPGRLEELSESLAFHFSRAQSPAKAVHYLVQSGRKAARRFALEEAHQFYQAAHGMLAPCPGPEQRPRLASLLLEWYEVFSRRADMRGLAALLEESREFITAFGEDRTLGRYFHRLGFCRSIMGQYREAESFVRLGLELSERAGDLAAAGRLCVNLCYICWELGRLEEAIAMGERAVAFANRIPEDQYLFIRSHNDLAKACNTAGRRERILELAAALRAYGEERAEPMAVAGGHYCEGIAQLIAGEPAAACASFNFGLESALEPFDHEVIRLWLSFALLYGGRPAEAEEVARSVVQNAEQLGFFALSEIAETNIALVRALQGDLARGRGILERILGGVGVGERAILRLQCEYYLAKVHLLRQDRGEAAREAEAHLRRAVDEGRAIGAWGFLGAPLLDLGTLLLREGRRGEAGPCLEEALALFERCGAAAAAAGARQTLAGLGREGSR